MKGFTNVQYAHCNPAHVKSVLRLFLNMLQHVLGNSLQCGGVSLLATCLAGELNYMELNSLAQQRWYGHVTRMFREKTAKQAMDTFRSGKRARGRPRIHWRNYLEDLAWSRLGIPPAKFPLVADRDA